MQSFKNDELFRIGIYVRESRDDNEENYETIEVQKNLLTDFVLKGNMGELIRIYEDDNISGSNFERRGIELLKEDVIAHEIDLLILKDLSRLGRNNAKTLLFLDFLEENNVRVITNDGRYDSLKDNETVGIDTWFNERYIRDISRKIRTNIRYKIEKGEYLGRAPYGYIKSSELKNKLCIDENTSNIIKEIYNVYKQGYGYSYIAKYLDSKKYPTPSERNNYYNSGHWNAVAIRRILTNPVYAGDTVQGVSEKISFKSKKTRRLPECKWVITRNTHEPIINREEFEEVQSKILSKKKISGPHKGILHLFRGIIFCGNCGSVMYTRTRKNRPVGYVCSNYVKNGKSKCTSHYLKEEFIKELIILEIKGLFIEDTELNKLVKLLEKEFADAENIQEEINRLEQLLLSKQRQQDILYTDKLEGKISEHLFLRMNSNIENRIDQLRHEIIKIKGKSISNLNYRDLIDEIFNNLNGKDITNEILNLVVEKIVVFEEYDDKSILEQMGIGHSNSDRIILIEFNF